MDEGRRPLRRVVRTCDHLANLAALILILLMLLYSGYSVWYTHSLTNGSFLSDEIAMYRPDGTDPTLADLKEANPDVRAWLTIDDTSIDYPVVQGEDNWEYLSKDVLGEFSMAGSVFLDSANEADFSDPYNIVYGHHIEGGAMFSDVLEFRDASFFNAHETGILWLIDRGFRIEIFACAEADGRDEVIYQDPHIVTRQQLPELAKQIMSRSLRTRPMELTENDTLIALSTCENAEGFERVLIFGRLIPMTDAEINAALMKNREQASAAAKGSDSDVWYAPLRRHPLISALSGALILLLLLFLLRKGMSKQGG